MPANENGVPESANFMEKFIKETPIPEAALEHFSHLPWTKALRENPAYECIPTFSRTLKQTTNEDYFFSKTINSPTTIRHQLTYKLRHLKAPVPSGLWDATSPATPKSRSSIVPPADPDICVLMDLGSPGMDGHPNTMHGGMLCAILDEMMGLCVMFHTDQETGPRQSIYTVQLDTKYRGPVPTPSNVLVRCWLAKKEGRKFSAVGQVCDTSGVVLTEAEGLWVMTKVIAQKL